MNAPTNIQRRTPPKKKRRRKRSPPKVSPIKRLFARLPHSILAMAVVTVGLLLAMASLVSAAPNKSIDADTLDGLDSSAFLGVNDTAANSQLLDNKDSTDFAAASHQHSGADIISGTVGASFIDDSIARDSEVAQAVEQVGSSFATQSALSDEVAARSAADDALRKDLAAEAQARAAEDRTLTYVTEQSMRSGMAVTETVQTYGEPLSIFAPEDGFVRLSGAVTVVKAGGTTGERFIGWIRHRQSAYGDWDSNATYTDLEPPDGYSGYSDNTTYGNIALGDVFPVRMGVNTFDIRVERFSNDGIGYAREGHLTAEYSPYGAALPVPPEPGPN